MNHLIDAHPKALAHDLGALLQEARPNGAQIRDVQAQLQDRHRRLPHLAPKVQPEEVVEGFFRCAVVQYLHERFAVDVGQIPACVNSSHTAVRGVCAGTPRHPHHSILDPEWSAGWQALKKGHTGVDMHVPECRLPKRADLYVVARDKIVSIEFKYLAPHGSLPLDACAAQVRLYLQNHAATLLVVYAGNHQESAAAARLRLHDRLDRRVEPVWVNGPAVTSADQMAV